MTRAKKIFVMPDTHFGPEDSDGNGGHDEPAFATALAAIKILKPDEFIHIGDVGEWNSCSHWRYRRRKRPPLDYTLGELDVDLFYVNMHMDRIDKVLNAVRCRKRHLIEGNHEVWVREMVGESKLAGEHYALPKQLGLEGRGWTWSPYGEYLKRGKLRLYHGGHYTTIHHAYQHALRCGASIMYGHTHDVQAVTVPSVEGPHGGYCIGCLAKLEKGFLKGRSTNWQHAFACVWLKKNGEFKVETYRIEGGWTVVNGREIQSGKVK